MKPITDVLQSEFNKISAKFRTVSVDHLRELSEELLRWKHDGLITEAFFKQNYGDFRFNLPDELPDTRSLIVIAVPQKPQPLIFMHQGIEHHTLIPPTYIYSSVRNACKEILRKALKKTNHSVTLAILPFKLLAVRSGLGEYGKNNLCYVDGMGSYIRLQAFFTDYEFPSDHWQDRKAMERCTGCSLCQQNCPTQCIPANRFLIHADHCLTYLNENEGQFPSWINPQCHHALVGCMRCQLVCPQNRSVIRRKEHPITFTEEETAVILKKSPRDQIPKSLSQKLIDLNMDEYYPLLSRNLSVLLKT